MEKLEKIVSKGKHKMKDKKYTDYLFVSDQHVPIYDKQANDLVIAVNKDIQPSNVIFGGDFIDNTYLSKYDSKVREASLQEEIDMFVNEIFRPMYEVNPTATYNIIAGNHDLARLKKFKDESNAFYGMRLLSLNNLLNESMDKYMKEHPKIIVLDQLDIMYKKQCIHTFKHGNKTSKHIAMAELMAEGVSGTSGHGHRSDTATYTNRNGTIIWNSVGHLSDTSLQEYMKPTTNGHPNWQSGFGYIQQFGGRTVTQNVLITRKNKSTIECVVNNKLYNNRGDIYE